MKCGAKGKGTADACLASIVNYRGEKRGFVTNGYGTAPRGKRCKWGLQILECLSENKLKLSGGYRDTTGTVLEHPPQWGCQTQSWTWGFRELGGFDHANQYGPYGEDSYDSRFPIDGTKGWCFTSDRKWGGVMLDPAAMSLFEQIKGTEEGIVLALD